MIGGLLAFKAAHALFLQLPACWCASRGEAPACSPSTPSFMDKELLEKPSCRSVSNVCNLTPAATLPQGFISIGCEPCTKAVLPNQHEREGRWWWEDSTAKVSWG